MAGAEDYTLEKLQQQTATADHDDYRAYCGYQSAMEAAASAGASGGCGGQLDLVPCDVRCAALYSGRRLGPRLQCTAMAERAAEYCTTTVPISGTSTTSPSLTETTSCLQRQYQKYDVIPLISGGGSGSGSGGGGGGGVGGGGGSGETVPNVYFEASEADQRRVTFDTFQT